ncbi:P-loop containing nucleoside triphosphate hydrolase protein [Morchella conica CCBAS932]|uniref:P-loop containing nucleoside triphosphate hydrolase protein n=1 Tax=Morchella conica CCBAS932 TaxID=1392247 RepID=A0A3N4KIA0_9PEZI|nr:P-loop containing nucleoside triphosphate hydrolase protein [Morchella conica CCBAS932]
MTGHRRRWDGGGIQRRLGISLATGSGKTVIFTQLISRLSHPSRPATATQTLILVHRKELVEQAASHCRRQYPHLTVEIEMATAHASGCADITVASIMSIVSGERIGKFRRERFKLVLIDECHHAVSKGYLKCLEHFGLVGAGFGADTPVLVGVSATMSRFDGLKLGKVLDRIVYHKDYMDMIADNWLSPCKFTTVMTHVDLSSVRDASTGDFNLSDLERAVNTKETNNVTVRSWLQKADDRHSTIVFCVNIQHVNDLCDTFRTHGIDARPITSNTLLQVRRERLEEFRARKFPVLVNCGVFTEGTDIPNIDCVLLARPTKSRNLLVQMIGRGMRLFPGKADCHIIDMVGVLKRGIATVPTLFGLDPDELLEELSPEQLQKLKAKREKEAEKRRLELEAARQREEAGREEGGKGKGERGVKLSVEFTDYENVFDLLKDAKESGHIRRLSPYSWVSISNGKHVLPLKAGRYLKIQRERDGTFTLIEFNKIPPEVTKTRTFLSNRRVVMEGAQSLADIIQGADTLAATRQARNLLLHSAPWRKKPASDSQLAFLSTFRDKYSIPENLTIGQAGDIITKLRHGSLKELEKRKKQEHRERVKDEKERARDEKARLKERMREEAREQKMREKEEKLRRLEEVKVGRLF